MLPTRATVPLPSLSLGGLAPRRWLPGRPRAWRYVGGAVLGALACYQVAVLGALWWQGTRDDRRPVDAILVLGAAQWNGDPSPVLRARLDHATELYRQGYASRIAVTGGVGDGDEYSEAGVAARYLSEQGVPAPAIVMEDRGRNSLESIHGAASVLAADGLSRVLLVSDPPHMLRILRMAETAGLEAYGSPATASPSVGSVRAQVRYFLRELVLYHGYQWLSLAPSVWAERAGHPGMAQY
jgi:uncharacterized SAM-binding protein YcdF (DUF218 family)